MGKKKTKQTQTYAYQTPPVTQQQQAFQDNISTAYDTPDPTIPFTFSNMRKNNEDRFDNPFGTDYSPEVADANRYAENNAIDQAQGAALRQDAMQRKQMKSGALGQAAGMSVPQLTQTGGTSVTSDPNQLIGGLLSAGGGLGQAALLTLLVGVMLGALFFSDAHLRESVFCFQNSEFYQDGYQVRT